MKWEKASCSDQQEQAFMIIGHDSEQVEQSQAEQKNKRVFAVSGQKMVTRDPVYLRKGGGGASGRATRIRR